MDHSEVTLTRPGHAQRPRQRSSVSSVGTGLTTWRSPGGTDAHADVCLSVLWKFALKTQRGSFDS